MNFDLFSPVIDVRDVLCGGKQIKKSANFTDEQVAQIELKLLFSAISSENRAKIHNVSPLLFKNSKKILRCRFY